MVVMETGNLNKIGKGNRELQGAGGGRGGVAILDRVAREGLTRSDIWEGSRQRVRLIGSGQCND